MKKLLGLAILLFAVSLFAQNAWLNEIHYDNASTDEGEFLEIVVQDAGNYSLVDFEVHLYNGSNGTTYGSSSLDEFTVGTIDNGFTFFYLNYEGIQNGSPDGVAISYDGDLLQFLSYEGVLSGTDGPANGVDSVDMGVEESGSTLVGESLQLGGTGEAYGNFIWQEATASTPGALNTNQNFGADTTPPTINSVVATEGMITISFSENVEETSAETTNNYIVTGRIVTVESAERDDANNTIVVLTVSGMEGGDYLLTINDIEDLAGNTAAELQANFSYSPPLPTIEFEDFNDLTLGDWTAISVAAPDHNWFASEYSDDQFAKISGYEAPEFCDDWLISPQMDFTGFNSEILSFISATNYDGPMLEVLISNDYDGSDDPGDFEWVALQPILSAGGWAWTESGDVDISAFHGNSVYIAFRYTSDDIGAATWEVDDILIAGDNTSADNNVVENIQVISNVYPNPFNPLTTISYTVPSNAFVTLEVYNVKGQKVKTLINKDMHQGFYTAAWNGTDENNTAVTSGLYFGKCVIASDENNSDKYTSTKKMLLLK